jgi:hypothetical protein
MTDPGVTSAKLYENYNRLCEAEVRDEKIKKHEEHKQKEIVSFAKNHRQVNWFYEFILLTHRNFLNYVRNKSLFLSRIINVVLLSLIIMGYYWDFGSKRDISLFINFIAYFFNNTNMFFINGLYTTLMMLPPIKSVLKRESSANLYRVSSFYTSLLVLLLLNSFIYAAVYTVTLYFTIGLYNDVSHFFLYYLANFLFFTFGQYFGLFFGSLFPGQISLIVAPFTFIFFMLGSGFYRTNASMPGFIAWLFDISPYKYFIEILVKMFADATPITKDLPTMLDYTFGIANCIYLLSGYMVVIIILGLIGMKFSTTKF